jgi:hypothetical protein
MKYKISATITLAILFTGCNEIPQIPHPHVNNHQGNFVPSDTKELSKPMDENETKVKKPKIKKPIKHSNPKPPKKDIKLKEVHDENFSPDYMYPTEKKSPKKVAPKPKPATTKKAMGKDECISLIGQERFDRYTQMLGSQDGAIKRCEMIKAQN